MRIEHLPRPRFDTGVLYLCLWTLVNQQPMQVWNLPGGVCSAKTCLIGERSFEPIGHWFSWGVRRSRHRLSGWIEHRPSPVSVDDCDDGSGLDNSGEKMPPAMGHGRGPQLHTYLPKNNKHPPALDETLAETTPPSVDSLPALESPCLVFGAWRDPYPIRRNRAKGG